jgi:hypothetical protein
LGNDPHYLQHSSTKKGKRAKKSKLVFYTKTENFSIATSAETGEWLHALFNKFSIQNSKLMLLEDVKESYEKQFSTPFLSFLRSKEWKTLRGKGLLLI